MRSNFVEYGAILAAVINTGMAVYFAVGLVGDPTFTSLEPRAAPESAVGVVFFLFLWLAFHAGLFVAIICEREA